MGSLLFSFSPVTIIEEATIYWFCTAVHQQVFRYATDLPNSRRSLANFSVEDIVAKEFSRFSSHGLAEARRRYAPIAPFDVQPPQLHSIIAYLGNLTFRLLYDDGSGSPLKQRSDVEVLYPISEDISDFISAAEHSSRQQALDLAISFIRNKNRKYPDEFSGLEVIDLTASGTSQILHESVS